MENEEDLMKFAEGFLSEEEETEEMVEPEGLTDEELVTLVGTEKAMIETDSWDLLSQQRINSTLQFSHTLNGDVRSSDGLSNVVLNFTTPSVETLTTYLVKVFCSDKETVVFSPTNPQLIPVADQATKMVNEVLHKYNSGYHILSRMFKDAAINKNSVLKITWDESTTSYEEDYENLAPGELEAIIAQKEQFGYEVEVVSEESVEEVMITQQPDPMTGEMVEVETSSSSTSVTIKCTHKKGMPKLECIPPEEFMINEGATSINESHLTRFVGHRRMLYNSDIKEMFPDVDPMDLGGSSSELEFDYETQSRHYNDGTYDSFRADNGQEATDSREVTECWIRADRDGDGIAEWRHVFVCGNTLLMDEPWYGLIPFASFSYFPIPHKFYGLSVYDKIRDYERSATALLRSEVDSSVMRNTTRIIADPRFVNARDLQTVKNGVIRSLPGFEPKHVMPLQAASGGTNSVQLMEIIRQQVIAEIGIDPISGQISTDVEKSGNDATKTSMVIDNASAKIEGYAREFADNCLRDIIWQILQLLVAHADDPSVQMLTESVSPGQPFALAGLGMQNVLNRSDLTAKVGLGHLSGQQRVAASQSMLQLVQAFSADPNAPLPIPPQAKLQMAYELAKGWGYENPEKLFGTVEEVTMAAQQAEMMKMQTMQAQQAQLQMQQQQLAMQGQQVQHQMQLAEQSQQFQQQLAMAQHDADLKTKAVEAEKTLADTAKTEADTVKVGIETEVAATTAPTSVNVSL